MIIFVWKYKTQKSKKYLYLYRQNNSVHSSWIVEYLVGSVLSPHWVLVAGLEGEHVDQDLQFKGKHVDQDLPLRGKHVGGPGKI